MISPLLEQAKKMAESYWGRSGGVFVFCNKERAEFCTCNYAIVDYDNYAFAIDAKLSAVSVLVQKILGEMKKYCIAQGLEFT